MAAPQTADGSPLRSGRFAGAPRTIERVSPSRSPGLRVIACAGLPGAGAPVACRRRSPRTVAGAATASACSGRPVFPFNPAGPELGQRHIRAGPVPRQWPGQRGEALPALPPQPARRGTPPGPALGRPQCSCAPLSVGPALFGGPMPPSGRFGKPPRGCGGRRRDRARSAGLIPKARFRPGASGVCPSMGGSGPFSRRRPGPIP